MWEPTAADRPFFPRHSPSSGFYELVHLLRCRFGKSPRGTFSSAGPSGQLSAEASGFCHCRLLIEACIKHSCILPSAASEIVGSDTWLWNTSSAIINFHTEDSNQPLSLSDEEPYRFTCAREPFEDSEMSHLSPKAASSSDPSQRHFWCCIYMLSLFQESFS